MKTTASQLGEGHILVVDDEPHILRALQATLRGAGTVNLAWTGLETGKKYLGQIQYNEGATTHATTIVRIDG